MERTKTKSIFRVLLITTVFSIIANMLYTAPVWNMSVICTQADGTEIPAFYTGDEFFGRHYDKNNYTMVIDSKTKYWCWAQQGKDGYLESTGYEIHLYTPESLGLKPGITVSKDVMNEIIERSKLPLEVPDDWEFEEDGDDEVN